MNYNEVKEINKELQKHTSKGFGYFIKNVGMVLLIILIAFILTNPTMITNPTEFFSKFNVASVWVVLVLFFALCGFYQLAKTVNEDAKKEQGREIIDEYNTAVDARIALQQEKHQELVNHRIKITPLIGLELKNLIIKLGASRVTVCEMHNGTNNFSGIPFVFLDCVYEEIDSDTGVDYVSDEFKNFNLGKFPFVANHFEEGTWIGSREEIEQEDKHLSAKLKYADDEYGAIVVLHGANGPIGFLTVSYSTLDHPNKSKIIAELNQSSQKISALLDNKD